MSKGSGRRIGLEISDSAVRAAEISSSGSRYRLHGVAQVQLPTGSVREGSVLDQSAVVTAIERCWKEGGFKQKEVHVGLVGLRAITRQIELPDVPADEVDQAARLQVLDVIPFPAERTLMAARPVGEARETDLGPMRQVLLAAAHRDLVDPILEAVKKAGLQAVSVDLSSTALVRALYEPTADEEAPEAIVSIGSELTTIVVHDNGVVRFVRTVAIGGDAITSAIASSLDIPFEDAEEIKRNLDRPGPHVRVAAAAATTATAHLLSEVQSSVEYYATLQGGSAIGRIVLTGGSSLLDGLRDRLAEQSRIEVIDGHLLGRVELAGSKQKKVDWEKREPLLGTVVGLALPDPPGLKPLNLLPPEIEAARRRRMTERRLAFAAVAVVLILAGLGVQRWSKVHNAETTVTALGANAIRLQSDIDREESHARTYQQITSDESAVGPVLDNEVAWPTVLDYLARATPAGGVVTSISGSYTPPVAPAAPVAGTAATTTTTTVAPASASSAAEQAREAITIATLNVSISTNDGYAYFKSWLKAMSTSPYFRYVTFSGLSAKASNVTWTAELDVLGTIESSRIGKFEVTSK